MAKNYYDQIRVNNIVFLIILLTLYIISSIFNIRLLTNFSACLLFWKAAILVDKYIPLLFKSFRNYTYQIFLIGIFSNSG